MRALDETLDEWKPVFNPPKNQGPTVTELRFIWTELQELLEDSAYVENERGKLIYKKFPISLPYIQQDPG